MQAGPAPIPVYRPSYLTDGLEFQGSLVESPANIFYQQISASRASISAQGSGRFQFQWRSVSDNLLMSPTVMLRFKVRIRCPVVWNQILAYIAVPGVRSAKGQARTEQQTYDGTSDRTQIGSVNSPCICFADSDAFTSCCSAINLTFNGTSLSLNRTDRFWRDYVRTQISSEDAARIYKSSGGAYDAGDAVGVAVPIYADDGAEAHADGNAHQQAAQAGLTMDSGIAERCKALYSLLEPAADAASGGTRILQVSYPVPVAPLNPWRGYSVPSTSPYKNTPLAIPHFSAGGLDFLIENFHVAFLRRMGVGAALAHGNAYGGGADPSNVVVSFEEGSAELELKYFRLAHTRSLKESYRFNLWQAQTFLALMPTNTSNAEGHQGGKMKVVGRDVTTVVDPETTSSIAFDQAEKTWTVKFDTINLAQVPSFLLISAPRVNEEYLMGGNSASGLNGAYIANGIRNKSANLFIKSIRLQVNNAQGHIDKIGTGNADFVNAERLFEMTRENSGSHYFKEGGFRCWKDWGMAVLLSSAQFAPGLMVSDGVAYPVNIDITMELQNRHVDVSALTLQGGCGHLLHGDKIRAQPQVTAIFTKIILATTETSATTNAMNFPLDSAERLLNSAGSMR